MTRIRLALAFGLAICLLLQLGGGVVGVPVGPKQILLVRETKNSDLGGVLVSLRNDPYMAKHTLDALDIDTDSPKVAAFKRDFPNVKPPALQIAIPGGRVVYCESLPAKPTAAGIITIVKANGGGE